MLDENCWNSSFGLGRRKHFLLHLLSHRLEIIAPFNGEFFTFYSIFHLSFIINTSTSRAQHETFGIQQVTERQNSEDFLSLRLRNFSPNFSTSGRSFLQLFWCLENTRNVPDWTKSGRSPCVSLIYGVFGGGNHTFEDFVICLQDDFNANQLDISVDLFSQKRSARFHSNSSKLLEKVSTFSLFFPSLQILSLSLPSPPPSPSSHPQKCQPNCQ